MIKYFPATVLVTLALLLTACTSRGQEAVTATSPTESPATVAPITLPPSAVISPTPAPQPTEIVAKVVSDPAVVRLVAKLRVAGIELRPRGISQVEWLKNAPGQAYDFGPAQDREYLFIHVYPDADQARSDAASIPHDNYVVIDWVNTPHFFRCENLIVLYLGNRETVLDALAQTCGAQFWGQAKE